MYDNDELKERRLKKTEEETQEKTVDVNVVIEHTAKSLGLQMAIVVGLNQNGEIKTFSPNNLPPPLIVGILEFSKASILARHAKTEVIK